MTNRNEPQNRLFTPPFAAIATAQLFSLLGEAILKFVLPLYLLNLSGSATLYGIVVACAFLPYIFLTPIGGALADRVNKKYVMAALDLVMAVSALAYVLLSQTADLVVLTIVILMLLYAAQSVYQPTVQSSVPSVVAHDRIPSATAIVTQVSALTGLVGPVVGGLVFGFFGVMPIVIVSIAAFFVSSVLIILFVKIPPVKHESTGSPLGILKSDIREAAAFLKQNPIMGKTILLATVINFVSSAFIMVGTPYMITEVLGLSNQLMGFAEASLALGGAHRRHPHIREARPLPHHPGPAVSLRGGARLRTHRRGHGRGYRPDDNVCDPARQPHLDHGDVLDVFHRRHIVFADGNAVRPHRQGDRPHHVGSERRPSCRAARLRCRLRCRFRAGARRMRRTRYARHFGIRGENVPQGIRQRHRDGGGGDPLREAGIGNHPPVMPATP